MWVLAASGPGQFGLTELSMTARLALQVRPVVPRFLHVGDAITLAAVLVNNTDQALTVRVGVAADRFVAFADGADGADGAQSPQTGAVARVGAHTRALVRFAAHVDPHTRGDVRLTFVCAAGVLADANVQRVPGPFCVCVPACAPTLIGVY